MAGGAVAQRQRAPPRGARARAARSGPAGASRGCRPPRGRPLSGSISASRPTSGSEASRGSPISTASSEWRWPSARSAVRQVTGPRKSEITMTRPGALVRRPRRLSALVTPCSSPWPSSATPSASTRSSPAAAPRPLRGASRRSQGPPQVSMATRPPRRVASRPRTRTTPSATSHFSRSAVPKAIEGETSSTSHVVIRRSGTCRRTWGMPVRALAAGSRRRTSSPGAYGRSWASSVPEPTPGERCSPGCRPPARRESWKSSASTRRPAIAPGPWRAAGIPMAAGVVTRRAPSLDRRRVLAGRLVLLVLLGRRERSPGSAGRWGAASSGPARRRGRARPPSPGSARGRR